MRRSRLRARVVAAATLVVLAALGGCTSGHHEQAARPTPGSAGCVDGDDGRAAASELLQRRTAAVRAGDAGDFLATVDPDARALRAAQKAWFARVRDLPGARVRFAISVNRVSEPGRVTTYVSQAVRLRGIDRRPVGVEHLVTFEQRDGCWLLTADQSDASQVVAAPWDLAGSMVEQRGGVVLLTDIREPGERERILGDAVRAWRTERRLVGRPGRAPADRGVVVMANRSPVAMNKAGIYHHDLDLTGAVTLPAEPGRRPGDVRVIVAPDMLGPSRVDEIEQIMRHEFVHVLTARDERAPRWAVEGVAEYYATLGSPTAAGRVTGLLGDAATAGTGLATEDFYDDDGAVRRGNYSVAWAAMVSLARTHGEIEPARLLEALSRAKADGDAARVDRVLERRYGLSADALGARARAVIAELR